MSDVAHLSDLNGAIFLGGSWMQGFEDLEVRVVVVVVVVEVMEVVVVMVVVMVVLGKVVAVVLLFVRRISCAQAYSPALAMAAVLVVELVVVHSRILTWNLKTKTCFTNV